MGKRVGIFCRATPNDPWKRLTANGDLQKMWGWQRLYPNKEIAMFEYGNEYSTAFDEYSAKHMRRVY